MTKREKVYHKVKYASVCCRVPSVRVPYDATVNTACSTGLVALSQADAAMRAGRCGAAIAGAASITFPNLGYRYDPGLMFSPDGRVRPFDVDAAGTVFGDAVGAMLLRNLTKARAARDHIWAVVRGTGVTNDGRTNKAGFAAPSASAQAEAVRRAMREARVTPRDVSYVECHATATSIGDGIEMRGLLDAYRTEGGPTTIMSSTGGGGGGGGGVEGGGSGKGWCALGSVKGNIGHANCAAGLTAVIKLAMCLRHQTLVPTANFRSLSPKVPLGRDSPFFINRDTKPWTRPAGAPPGQPLVGGVSSFGIGGTNAHAVLSTEAGWCKLGFV